MEVERCDIAGPLLISPDVRVDERGFFLESWNADTFRSLGIEASFVQDNHSRSKKGVLRGIHFQNPGAQGKLVRVVGGSVFDVAVDLRKSSPTFGQWIGAELNDKNHRMLWVPEGFGHGFLVLEDDTDVLYKCSAPYRPEHEQTLKWDDPKIGIDWPINNLDIIVSDRDRDGLPLDEVRAFR